MVESMLDPFELREYFIEDLGVMKGRAGGGIPTYLYKSQKISDALDEVDEEEVFLFTDVDIQFLSPVQELIENISDGMDLVLQREFEDIGVNIGFLALRKTAACIAFWKHVRNEIERTQALDQRVVNNALYSGLAAREFGLRWDKFPSEIWASSQAWSGPAPEKVLVHHANFTVLRSTSADPSGKLCQMADVRSSVRGDRTELDRFVTIVQNDQTMADYRDRHFGARRPGPEWSELPVGHIARPGGFREPKKKKAPSTNCQQEKEEPCASDGNADKATIADAASASIPSVEQAA
eukprot:TRINITY_DN70597_c0_g1_i1.p1 TRINITY_DN70597_c0_g1~~TRINITY_DN70597_c0_g1_i1.p1  ORF type:complete len:344 (-),score=51.47 TRINITY_DN70597_c0_g1_i1:70-951(-)